jgi:hypothetical protein
LVAEAEEAAAVEVVRVAVVEEEAAAAAAEARLVAEAAETARLRLAAVEAARIAAEQADSRLAAEDAQFDAGDALPPGGCQQVSKAGAAVGLQEALLAKVPTVLNSGPAELAAAVGAVRSLGVFPPSAALGLSLSQHSRCNSPCRYLVAKYSIGRVHCPIYKGR